MKRTCNQCHKKMVLSVAIQNTNIAFPKLSNKPIYNNDDRLLSVCDNPECPNYSLVQISVEQMPKK